MAGKQQQINLSKAVEKVTAENITQRNLPAILRDQILDKLPKDKDITSYYIKLTSNESGAYSRHFHLLEMGYAAETPTASGYPPITPADDGAKAFMEGIIEQLATNDQSQTLISSFVAAFSGEGGEGDVDVGGMGAPSNSRGAGRAGAASQTPARGNKSDAGPGKRFYCHECGCKHQFRSDMKRHFKKHFPGHEVDALVEEWDEDHSRWGPWTEDEAAALGRDHKGMKRTVMHK